MAMPFGMSALLPGRDLDRRIGWNRGNKIKPGGERALIFRHWQVATVRQSHNTHLDVIFAAHLYSPFSAAAMRCDQGAGDFVFGFWRPGFDFLAGDEMNRVDIAAHDAGCRRHIVGNDPVAALLGKLGLGVGNDIVGLGGEANDQRRPADLRCAMMERISGFSTSSMVGARPCFLILLWLSPARTPIGDGGGKDSDIHRQRPLDRGQHLPRGFDIAPPARRADRAGSRAR